MSEVTFADLENGSAPANGPDSMTARAARELGIDKPRLVAAKPGDKMAPRRSMFDDDRSSWSAKISMDGYTYYIRAMSDAVKAREARFAEDCAAAMNMPVAEFRNTKMFVDEKLQNIYLQAQKELYEAVLNDALIAWTADVPVSAERIAHLHPDIKRNLSDFIVAFSKYGTSEQEFFRQRFGPAV